MAFLEYGIEFALNRLRDFAVPGTAAVSESSSPKTHEEQTSWIGFRLSLVATHARLTGIRHWSRIKSATRRSIFCSERASILTGSSENHARNSMPTLPQS